MVAMMADSVICAELKARGTVEELSLYHAPKSLEIEAPSSNELCYYPGTQRRQMSSLAGVVTKALKEANQEDFLKLFGFGLSGVDYDQEVDPMVSLDE